MTELEQINEKLNKIVALLQPKKEVKNISNGLDEVRAELRGLKPYPMAVSYTHLTLPTNSRV